MLRWLLLLVYYQVLCSDGVIYTGFYTDMEALYGVGDRGCNKRPEIADQVVSGRLLNITE